MFGSKILEVAIGMMFVYLLFSLLVTIINETIASFAKWRASDLEDAIRRMFNEAIERKSKSTKGQQQQIQFANPSAKLSAQFYQHPIITGLVKKETSKPSYIDAATFGKVLTDIILTLNVKALATSKTQDTLSDAIKKLHGQKTIAAVAKGTTNTTSSVPPLTEIQELLLSFSEEVHDDVDAFKRKLEEWFNHTMDRVSGWYTRMMKWITLLVGLIVAGVFNVDTFEVYSTLNENATIRNEFAQAAADYLKSSEYTLPTGVESGKDDDLKKIKEFVKAQINPTQNLLGLGWGSYELNDLTTRKFWGEFLVHFLGWAVTALAISLGAPFWFDMLNKVMKLRGTGKVERSEPDPKTQPVG